MSDDSPWPGGEAPRYRPGSRPRRLGPPPGETSVAFQVVPTAISLVLALVLLVWYAAVQRQVRVTGGLDRLEAILDGGAAPVGRSVAEAACVEVQYVEAEVVPVVATIEGAGPWVQAVAPDAVRWVEGLTGMALSPWLDTPRLRDAARALCDGVRHAARARSSGSEASAADVAASQAAFGRGLEALATIDPHAIGAVTRLARVGARLGEVRAALATHGLDAASLVALSLASGPTVAGEGRDATWLVVARAHPGDGRADAVAIARVTVRDGVIVAHRVDTAAGWQPRPARSLPVPVGLAPPGGSPEWRLADFDWWLDFRRDAAQLLALWDGAGQDSSAIDGIVAVDGAALAMPGDPVPDGRDDVAVARHLDGQIAAASRTRGAAGALLARLARASREGLAVAWAREPAIQAVIEARGWAGVPAAPPVGQVAVVGRATRGPRAYGVEVVGPAPAGVRATGEARARLVVAASLPVRAVAGAAGPVEATREGDLVVLDVPVDGGVIALVPMP